MVNRGRRYVVGVPKVRRVLPALRTDSAWLWSRQVLVMSCVVLHGVEVALLCCADLDVTCDSEIMCQHVIEQARTKRDVSKCWWACLVVIVGYEIQSFKRLVMLGRTTTMAGAHWAIA